jgi:hypothetical protein
LPKKQKTIAKDVNEVRRNRRLAKLCDGYKDKVAVDKDDGKKDMMIGNTLQSKEPKGKKVDHQV